MLRFDALTAINTAETLQVARRLCSLAKSRDYESSIAGLGKEK